MSQGEQEGGHGENRKVDKGTGRHMSSCPMALKGQCEELPDHAEKILNLKPQVQEIHGLRLCVFRVGYVHNVHAPAPLRGLFNRGHSMKELAHSPRLVEDSQTWSTEGRGWVRWKGPFPGKLCFSGSRATGAPLSMGQVASTVCSISHIFIIFSWENLGSGSLTFASPCLQWLVPDPPPSLSSALLWAPPSDLG